LKIAAGMLNFGITEILRILRTALEFLPERFDKVDSDAIPLF